MVSGVVRLEVATLNGRDFGEGVGCYNAAGLITPPHAQILGAFAARHNLWGACGNLMLACAGGHWIHGRRGFITLLVGAAASRPIAVYAQKSAVPVIGFLNAGSPEAFTTHVRAFQQGLQETGYVEGRNVAIEFRSGPSQPQPSTTDGGASLFVAKLLLWLRSTRSPLAPLAVKAETAGIPIVFGMGGDPVEVGLVNSLNRPGGNITGITVMNVDVTAKRIELLEELLPSASRFAALVNTDEPRAKSMILELKDARIGREIESPLCAPLAISIISLCGMRKPLGRAFGDSKQPLYEPCGPTRRSSGADGIPTSYFTSQFATLGGLMSYGGSIKEAYRLVGLMPAEFSGEANLPICRSSAWPTRVRHEPASGQGAWHYDFKAIARIRRPVDRMSNVPVR